MRVGGERARCEGPTVDASVIRTDYRVVFVN